MKKIFIPIFICLCLIAYVVGYTTTTSTTNLELVKIAEGDLIFDWFDTMNDNLDLIDAVFDTVTLTEFSYLDGVTSAIQTQLNTKPDEDTNTTYTAGDFLTLTGTDFDVDTAAVTTGDTTHVPTSGGVFTFCETTQNYALYSELHAAVTIGTANGLSLSTQALSLQLATTDQHGALSDTDWNTFNNKLSNITGESIGDLSDVGVTTPTDKYVLVADGDSWESRALVEADISDLGTYLEDITGESIFDLSDVTADPNADKYLKWDDDPGEIVWVDATGFTDLTDFDEQTAFGVFYSNTDGDVTELALGSDGTFLMSNGVDQNPTFETPAGAGDMLKADYDSDEDNDIDVASGGTEKSLWTLYAIPYLSGTTAFGEISIGTAGQVLKVSTGATGYEFANESDPTVDEDSELKAILVDEVTKTGDFTAGRMAIINNASGIIEQGTNTDTDVDDAVSKKHTQNTDTTLVLTNALGSDHTYSGEVDSQPVGENVVFGQLLYYDWTDVEWKLAKADAFATAKATRIALETKANGETCLMLVKGYIRDDSAFDFGAARVFLNDDTAGTCDDTAPAESGDQIQVVGTAKSADILFFNPSQDVGEI